MVTLSLKLRPPSSWQHGHNTSQIMSKMNAFISDSGERRSLTQLNLQQTLISSHLLPANLCVQDNAGGPTLLPLLYKSWVTLGSLKGLSLFQYLKKQLFCRHLRPIILHGGPLEGGFNSQSFSTFFSAEGTRHFLLASSVTSLVLCFPSFLACLQTELLLLFLKRANDLSQQHILEVLLVAGYLAFQCQHTV